MVEDISYIDSGFKSGSSFNAFLGDGFDSKSAARNNEMAPQAVPTTETSNTTNQDKNIIKEGDLNIYADDIDDTLTEIDSIAKKYQAESQNTYDSGKGINRRVNIAVQSKSR